MLTGMDIPVAAAPWLVLGVVLGTLLPVLTVVGVLAVRRRRPGPDAPAAPSGATAGFGEDDLPAFLEFPPGSAPPAAAARDGWAPLSTAAPPAPAPPARQRGAGTTGVLAAMAGTALLLIGAAAAVATARAPGPADPHGQEQRTTGAPRPGTVDARLTFAGVVLERHAVGVTVAYPRVRVRADGDRAVAEIELPTFNCLRTEAPEDPLGAGCAPSVPEYAELSAPDLQVAAGDGALRVSGRFATSSRPTGSPPRSTGRVYELTVSAFPRDGRAGTGREPATGQLQLGDERVRSSAGEPNTITFGG